LFHDSFLGESKTAIAPPWIKILIRKILEQKYFILESKVLIAWDWSGWCY